MDAHGGRLRGARLRRLSQDTKRFGVSRRAALTTRHTAFGGNTGHPSGAPRAGWSRRWRVIRVPGALTMTKPDARPRRPVIVLPILNLFAIAISDRSQSVAPRPHKRSRAEAHTPRPGLGQRLAPNVCATHLAVDVATIADRSARALIWVNRRGCIVTSVSIPDLARLDPAGLGRVRPDSTGGQVWRP